MSDHELKPLKYEEVLRAHAGYAQVLAGFQLVQTGFEEVMMSQFFKDVPDEQKKIKEAITLITSQSRDIAKAKGCLLGMIQNIDALGAKIIGQIDSDDPTNSS